MLLKLVFPLLFSSVLYSAIPYSPGPVETKQLHTKEEETQIEEDYTDVACSCVSYVLTKRPDLPSQNASQFTPATTTPYQGGVTLFWYPNSGLYHVAYNEFVDLDRNLLLISETNYDSCMFGKRWIELDDPNNRIIGFI